MPNEESLSGITATVGNETSDPQSGSSAIEITFSKIPPGTGGYHEIAELMVRFPATAVFKCFGFLNTLNILYLQAELARLEKELLEVARKNKDSPDQFKQHYFQSFSYLQHGLTDSEERDKTH